MRKWLLSLVALVALTGLVQAASNPPIITYSSGAVAAGTAAATVAAATQQFSYLAGFEVTAGGSTAGLCVDVTVTGLLGGTAVWIFCAPAGAAVPAPPLVVNFVPPLQGAAKNTAIVVSMPTLGVGNLKASVNAHGYAE